MPGIKRCIKALIGVYVLIHLLIWHEGVAAVRLAWWCCQNSTEHPRDSVLEELRRGAASGVSLACLSFSLLIFPGHNFPRVEGDVDCISPCSGLPLQTLGMYLTGKWLTAREHLYDDTVNDCTTNFIDAKDQDSLHCALEQAWLGWKVGEWRCQQRWAPSEDHTEMMHLPADGGWRSLLLPVAMATSPQQG